MKFQKFITLFTILLANLAYGNPHALSEKISEAIQSPYSDRVYKALDHWPPKIIPNFRSPSLIHPKDDENPVWFRGIKTPGNSLYIGTIKQIRINAPLATVSALIQDFEAYPKLFEEVKEVKILETDQNKLTVHWERYSPVFFIPNIKYDLVYLIAPPTPTRAVLRYQLKKGNSLKNSDGIVVMEGIDNATLLTGLDFYNASWGLAGAVAEGKIWKDSFRGSYKGDLAVKFKAEHPDWTRDQIKKEAEAMLKKFPIETVPMVEYDFN